MKETYQHKMIFAKLWRLLFLFIALIAETYRFVKSMFKMMLFKRRHRVIQIFQSKPQKPSEDKVLAVITHVLRSSDSAHINDRANHLRQSIDCLLKSFSHCHLEIIINTLPGKSAVEKLPEYQQSRISLHENDAAINPMKTGFKTQDVFLSKVSDFDWFLFLEDDILLTDCCFLQKLELFNKHSLNSAALLLPNRYEMRDGHKTYPDIADRLWNKLSIIDLNGLKFAECQNMHAAFYCLSREQLKKWDKSGRYWYEKNFWVGFLECAATGCLYESFELYKPYLTNLYFLEVEHCGIK